MANYRRGEIAAELGGKPRRLVLTLGALAELEAAFDVTDLVALAERFGQGRLSAHEILLILAAGLRGAGEALSDAEVAQFTAPGGAAGFARIAAELLSVTFGGEAGAEPLQNPPPGRSPSPGRRSPRSA